MRTLEIKKATKELGKLISKNSPTILTGVSVAGLVTTTVMAVRATPKACRILDEEEWRRGHEHISGRITNMDIVKMTWKLYVPAAIMGSVTIACIVCANSINLRRYAALASVYSLSETALKEYQSKVVETIGANKERQIKDEIAKDKILKNPPKDDEIIITGKGDTLCFEWLSGRYFKSDIEKIRKAENELAHDMLTSDFISVNDVYDVLGLEHTGLGDEMGWPSSDGLFHFECSSQLTENSTPCLVVGYFNPPTHEYMDFH